MQTVTKVVYVLNGIVFLAAGGAVLLLGTNLLSDSIRQYIIVGAARGDAHTLHILQELGCLLVFAGLVTFWFVRHYEQSRAFHWAMTLFWALFALIHWFDTTGRFHYHVETWITTMPFGLFALAGVFRSR